MRERVARIRERLADQGLAEEDLPFCFDQADFKTGLLLLHGSAATPCNHRSLAQQMFGLGYSVYAPLLAGHDDPERLYSGEVTWLDCYHSATEALSLLSESCDRVFVIGSSFGGTLAYLMAVEHADRLAGAIALSAPSRPSARWQPQDPWGQQIKAATAAAEFHLSSLDLPILVAHAIDDTVVSFKNALYAYETIQARRKKLVIYEGIGHALGFGFNTPELAQDIHHFISNTDAPRRFLFRFRDRGYQQVALSGEFNGWQASSIPLSLNQDFWESELALLPGVYQYKVVINGRDWIVDPDADAVATPHGKQNGLLRVS